MLIILTLISEIYLLSSEGAIYGMLFHTGIRLNVLQYGELKEKLNAPLREARGIIIQQTLGDMFIDAFKKQVDKNGVYGLPLNSPVSRDNTSQVSVQYMP